MQITIHVTIKELGFWGGTLQRQTLHSKKMQNKNVSEIINMEISDISPAVCRLL